MRYSTYMCIPVKQICSIIFILVICCSSCNNSVDKKVVSPPLEINEVVKKNIENIINETEKNHYKSDDSILLSYHRCIKNYYANTDYEPLWCNNRRWLPRADSLIKYIEHAELEGLYKEDYHLKKLQLLKSFLLKDSVTNLHAASWANADVLMCDAFAGLLNDLKHGRLITDSLLWKNDTVKFRTFFETNFNKIKKGENISNVLEAIQPQMAGYKSLKKSIQKFTDSMDTYKYTYLIYPAKDSVTFIKLFKKRIGEAGIVINANADSVELNKAIKHYQKLKGLKQDGKIGINLINKLNSSDRERFNIIAITLDKYKMLPEIMPEKYVWVNLPSYNLKVYNKDSIAFESKIICGKSLTPTPVLTSQINNIVLYPTWTVPASIISKDMLPGLKRNTSYLARKGLYLLNGKGQKIDPANINWTKYNKGIPFTIQQASGDGNALGVIKFNFENPYSVYLHDTNQRYLFKNNIRALSHGCVRVQEWQKLVNFIVRNDSINLKKHDIMHYNTDSITNWIAHKEKHSIEVKNKVPLFIRYFSCESINGSIKFYDDIYGIDKELRQKFFAGK